ncbi:MAG: hypothetical protein QM638_18645 [Nocardioides sp.]|uniref:hypothetical protein n=1 Tax=Nocardioides sp. TaxID=35761 RepID=UPI0039E4A9AC
MGQYRLHITVTDNGPDCSMPNDEITLTSTIGDKAAVTMAAATGDTPHLVRQVARGKSLDFSVGFDTTCTDAADAQQATNPVALSLGGDDIPVSGTSLPDALTNCSGVDLIAPSEDDETTYAGLRADVTLPETATGSTLDYTVTLSNASRKAITFRTCPSYTQSANVYGKGKTTQTYRLNCAGHRRIPPGGSLTFAMQLALPDATGRLKLGWFLDHGPSTVGALVHKE